MRVVGDLDYDEIKSFVREHGKEAYVGDWKDFDSYIDYFARMRRVYILRDKRQRILGIACLNNVSDVDFIMHDRMPLDNPDGEIVYVHGLVIHSRVRHRNIMGIMLRYWLKAFPQIKYVVFKRDARGGKYKMIPVKKLL